MKNDIKIIIGIGIFISLILSNAGSLFAMGLTQVGFKDTVNFKALKKQWNAITIKDSNGVVFQAPKDVVLTCQNIKDLCDDILVAQSGIIDFTSETADPKKDRDSLILLFETIKHKDNPDWLASRSNKQIATIYEFDRNLQAATSISLAIKKEYKKRFPELAKSSTFKDEVRMLKNSVIKHNPENIKCSFLVHPFKMLDLSQKSLDSLNGLEKIPQNERDNANYLDISHNKLTKINFAKLYRLFPNIHSINASHNEIGTLKGNAPANLVSIDLSHNKIAHFNPEIFSSNQRNLILDSNMIHSESYPITIYEKNKKSWWLTNRHKLDQGHVAGITTFTTIIGAIILISMINQYKPIGIPYEQFCSPSYKKELLPKLLVHSLQIDCLVSAGSFFGYYLLSGKKIFSQYRQPNFSIKNPLIHKDQIPFARDTDNSYPIVTIADEQISTKSIPAINSQPLDLD